MITRLNEAVHWRRERRLEPEADEGRKLDLRQRLKECDTKLGRYRALLDQDGDLAVVANWIAEVDKRAIYDELGVNLTYHPDGRVHVGAGKRCTQGSRRRGDLRLEATPPLTRIVSLAA